MANDQKGRVDERCDVCLLMLGGCETVGSSACRPNHLTHENDEDHENTHENDEGHENEAVQITKGDYCSRRAAWL